MRLPTSTLSVLTALATVSVLSTEVQAQEKPPPGVTDWRMPFRHPQQNIAPPEKHFVQLRIMRQIAGAPGEHNIYYDNGVEVCDHPDWQRAYDTLKAMPQDAGWLSLILRDGMSPEERALAFYGAFYVPNPQLVFALIEHIPGEPGRPIREDAYQRAIAFIKAHLHQKNDGDLDEWSKLRVGPAGQLPPKPGDYSFSFSPVPFIALLQVRDWRDQVQGLWFLRECIAIRPSLALPYFDLMLDILPTLISSKEKKVVAHVCSLLALVDPNEKRHLDAKSDSEDLLTWLDAIVYDIFPPIRRISAGLYDLYKSPDLDKILEVGTELLTDGSLGDTADGTLANKQYYRGLRIARLLEPLDKLGFTIGDVIIAINGVPVATTNDVLNNLRASKRQRQFLVEFVAGRHKQARKFRLQ